MPLWESYEPVAHPGEESSGNGGVDPRWTRCNNAWEAMQAAAPLVALMHPMAPDHVHEEIELQLPDFSSYNLEWVARAPQWRDYYRAHDQTPHYAYMKTVLQILQWYRPRERWVLKSPQHLEQVGPLLSTFPDATVVVTHRDPVAVVQSTITMACYGARTAYRTPRPEWYRDYWTERIGLLLDASLRDRQLLPDDRTVDVYFDEYMADEMGTLERVYRCAGMELTEQARGRGRGVSAGPSPGPRGHGRLRPASRLLDHARGGAGPLRDVPRPFPRTNRGGMSASRPVSIEQQVDHLIDTRPGRELLRPVYDDPAVAVAEGIYRSGGCTAAYLVLTDSGRVIVNTGMGFEAPHHRRVFDAVRPGPTHSIVTTQGHVDHLGGVDLFKAADGGDGGATPVYVAQENNQACQADDARIRGLRMRTAGIWFDTLGTDARRIFKENPGVSMQQSEPVPDVTVGERLELDCDGLRMELIAAVGETVDSLIVWLPSGGPRGEQPVRSPVPPFPQPAHVAG